MDIIAQGNAALTNFRAADGAAGNENLKMYYYGYSLGALQMISGLSLEFTRGPIVELFERAILLAPCTVLGPDQEPVENITPTTNPSLGFFKALGVHSIPSDDWENDKTKLCNASGNDETLCNMLNSLSADYPGRMPAKLSDHIE